MGDVAVHGGRWSTSLTANADLPTVDHLPSHADVLVVGSGAGGAPTAALLAEAGLDVVIVEEGELVRQGEVTPFSLEQMDRQYRAGGVTAALGRPAIAYAEGCCAGGGTEINSGLYRRPPEDVLRRWRESHGLDDLDIGELYAICDEVEAELSVQPLPGPPIPASDRLRRGRQRLGWDHGEIPRWMAYSGSDPQSARRRSMTETYLPRATAAGAQLAVGQRVDRLVVERRGDGSVATGAVVTSRGRRDDADRRRQRDRVRWGDPDPGTAATIGSGRSARCPTRRPSHGQAGRLFRRRAQRS